MPIGSGEWGVREWEWGAEGGITNN